MEGTAARERTAQRDRIGTLALLALALVGSALVVLLAPLDYRMPIVLGIVQGLSEFLPISSSAHLILVPRLLGWPDLGLTFDVALHMGTLLAVVVYFWRDWLGLLGAAHRPGSPQGRLFWYLVLATLPAGVAGVVFEDVIETHLRSLYVIPLTLSSVGLLLWLVDRRSPQHKELQQVTLRDALLVGLAQALALIPGVSRSGITILTGRTRGMSRETAARFSFLLSTPVIAGAGIFKLRDLQASDLTGPFLAGVLASAVVGALAIGLLLRYLRREGFAAFAIYRVVLALALLAFALL